MAAETARAFRAERERHEIQVAVSHDSYLINLATPDAELFEKSYNSFRDRNSNAASPSGSTFW